MRRFLLFREILFFALKLIPFFISSFFFESIERHLNDKKWYGTSGCNGNCSICNKKRKGEKSKLFLCIDDHDDADDDEKI